MFQSGIQSTLVVGILFLFFISSAYADQTGTNYGIPFDVNNAGGADVSKSNIYLLSDSLGEPIVGHGDSNIYKLDSGYRQPSASDYISLSCTNVVDLGSVVGSGQKSGSGTCTVYTDAYDGYRMVWQAGANNRSGLVGHWKMDETSGTTAYDLSGNGNNGTLTAGPTISTDTPSKYFSTRSVSFDGTDDVVIINDSNSLDMTEAITISYWEKQSTANFNNGIVFKGPLTSSQGVYSIGHYQGTNSKIMFRINGSISEDNGQITSSTDLAAGTWYHVAATYDRTNMKIYINGVLEKTNSFTPAINTNADPLHIGSYYDTSHRFNGLIDDVRIYNTALSNDEIRDLASKAPPGSLTASGSQVRHIPGIFFPFTGGLVGHWKMEETITGTVADSSGYNNDGTPAGAGGANNTPQPSTSVPGSMTFLTTRSMDFDGTDDYVNGPTDVTGTSPTTETFALWIRPDSTVSSRGFLEGATSINSTVPNRLLQMNAGGTIRALPCNVAYTASTSTALIAGSWTHVTWVRNGTSNKIYVNGTQEVDSSVTATCAASTLHIGAGYPTYFDGQIDDVRIYNRALTAAEIKALYSEPQAWSVAATESAWGARLSSDSTDDDSKWGTDGGSEKWLNLGDGAYTVVRRATATPLSGSVEYMEFRGEVGSSKVQTAGVYRGVATFTVVGY